MENMEKKQSITEKDLREVVKLLAKRIDVDIDRYNVKALENFNPITGTFVFNKNIIVQDLVLQLKENKVFGDYSVSGPSGIPGSESDKIKTFGELLNSVYFYNMFSLFDELYSNTPEYQGQNTEYIVNIAPFSIKDSGENVVQVQ